MAVQPHCLQMVANSDPHSEIPQCCRIGFEHIGVCVLKRAQEWGVLGGYGYGWLLCVILWVEFGIINPDFC
jgi:hypothetical protein